VQRSSTSSASGTSTTPTTDCEPGRDAVPVGTSSTVLHAFKMPLVHRWCARFLPGTSPGANS
jgi:hypothetical protein